MLRLQAGLFTESAFAFAPTSFRALQTSPPESRTSMEPLQMRRGGQAGDGRCAALRAGGGGGRGRGTEESRVKKAAPFFL